MTVAAALLSSASSTWRTPDCVLDLVRQVGPIQLDPCTTVGNPTGAVTICVPPRDWDPRIHDPGVHVDGLAQDWIALADGGMAFVNPPYGRLIGEWVKRCYALGQLGGECIALLPSRTDTRWWDRWCAPPASAAVCFWRGRLTFVGAPSPAPFPSAIVYWGHRPHRFADVFRAVGSIWT